MKFGICTDWHDLNNIRAAKEAGAEYVELNFSSFADASEEQIAALSAELKRLDIPCLAYNGMLFGNFRLTGKNKDFATARAFLEKVLQKVQCLDARTVVFGSGGARALDGDNTKENGMAELAVFLHDYVGPLFAEYGFTCVIEPLSECNFLKTVEDGFALEKAAGHPSVRLLADFYHVFANGESLAGYEAYRGHLRHTHIASATGRIYPRQGEDYTPVFRALRAAEYDALISVEAIADKSRTFLEEASEALACLRAAYTAV